MKRVTIISRQSDTPSMDIRMLADALSATGCFDVKIMCKRLAGNYAEYSFHMLEQIREIRLSDVLIVDGYCIVNSLFKHPRKLKVIQMWHALAAIKQFGWQTVGKADGSSEKVAKLMKMHRGYDYVLSSSDITAKYFCEGFRTGRDHVVKLGLPRIDYILSNNPEEKNEILRRYPKLQENRGRIMLYVPTFRKGRTVDAESLAKEATAAGYTVVVKLHPLDKTELESQDNVIVDNEFNSYAWLKVADVIVSDYSSYVVEASLTDKPLYLYTYDKEEYMDGTGLNVNFAEEPIAKYEFRSANDLVEDARAGEYDFEALRAFRNRYIDIDTDNCTGQIVKFIEEITAR